MSAPGWDRITTLVIIVGLVVLMALGKIAAEAGLGLIGALAGVHIGTAATARSAQAIAEAQSPAPSETRRRQ